MDRVLNELERRYGFVEWALINEESHPVSIREGAKIQILRKRRSLLAEQIIKKQVELGIEVSVAPGVRRRVRHV